LQSWIRCALSPSGSRSSLRFGVKNDPERIPTPGDTFFEPLGGIHTTNGSADPNTLARALVFMVVPKGAAAATAVDPPKP
jgi:hypothetical protein